MDSFLVTVANIVPGTILLPIGLLITGWTTQNHVFWLVPDIVSDLNCALLLGRVLRDTYTGRALHFTTALAAATLLRSLAGFGFPLFAPTMYNALGYGNGDTILAVAAIVLGCPACVKSATRFPAHV